MTAAALLLALAVLPGAPGRAEDGEPDALPETRAVEADSGAEVAEIRRRLESDPEFRAQVAARVLRSRIADAVSRESDPRKRREDALAWVAGDPASAAEIAAGLARDDARGSPQFENGVLRRVRETFARNPNANKGAYGVLKSAARRSKTAGRADADLSEEQRREMIRSLFEGKGAQGERVIDVKSPDAAAAGPAAAAGLSGSFYDRLSAANIRGYSPQLLALQSALNARRPPGAPRLIETGTLDFATLSYPAHGLRYDASNLEERLRRERLAALASLAGERLAPESLRDPSLESRLAAKVPAGKLPARLASRAELLARARAAVSAFEAAAARSRDPGQLSASLLVELSGRQREAARWITAAALEEELGRVEAEEGFLTAELLAAIEAAPADAATRQSYKGRGVLLQERLAALKANALKALDALRSDGWLSALPGVERLLAENQALRRNLFRDISDYRFVPHAIADSRLRQARWRRLLDETLVRYFPSTAYGRAVAARRERLARLLEVFGRVAAGDSDGARNALAALHPGAR